VTCPEARPRDRADCKPRAQTGPVAGAHVTQDDASDLSTSALTVTADVTNNTDTAQTALVNAVVTPPHGGGGPISL
jgi:hypothetical protein